MAELSIFGAGTAEVGDVPQREQACRAGEQKASGAWINVHLMLDRKQEVRHALHFVDEH
ncbi:MAG: hypothetical protein ACRDQ7_17210 [Haloechinothrix sp.]